MAALPETSTPRHKVTPPGRNRCQVTWLGLVDDDDDDDDDISAALLLLLLPSLSPRPRPRSEVPNEEDLEGISGRPRARALRLSRL